MHTDSDRRTAHCAYFLTPEDRRLADGFAKSAGFRSIGHMTTAIMERLIIGGFCPMAFLKTGWQLSNYARENGSPFAMGFYFGVRPLPALPDCHISDKEIRDLAASLKAEKTKA